MKHEAFFRKHPVFTGEELKHHLSGLGEGCPRTRESLLNYPRSRGHVILIRRGSYAAIPSGTDPHSYPVDPFLVAAKFTAGAVLSYHTALAVHAYAYATRESPTYSAASPTSPVMLRSHTFRGVKRPLALSHAKKVDYGVISVDPVALDVRAVS